MLAGGGGTVASAGGGGGAPPKVAFRSEGSATCAVFVPEARGAVLDAGRGALLNTDTPGSGPVLVGGVAGVETGETPLASKTLRGREFARRLGSVRDCTS